MASIEVPERLEAPRRLQQVGWGARTRAGAGAPQHLVLWSIAAAWGFMILAQVGGWAELFGHEDLIEDGPGPFAALGLFLVGWEVMVAAMMLPSSLSAFRWFSGLVEGRVRPGTLGVTFLGGYLSVWTAFGVVAFAGDGLLHDLIDRWPWLAARPWLIGGSMLVLAGAFEISWLAERCRAGPVAGVHPGTHIDPARAARMGVKHGIERLRRCWPLMVLSFALGMTSLVWMGVLTVVMSLEGAGTWRRLASAQAGAALLGLGVLVLAHPGWLPSMFPAP